MLHRQGNFVTGFFPEDVQAELDEAVGVFALPAWEGGFDGVPMLGGGDLAALFAPDDDEAIQVMEFITSEGFGARSEEHTSELQSRGHLVCRLLLEKKK